MEKVRIGIIGAGSFAHAHARALTRIPGATVVAVADHTKEKAEAFCREFGWDGAVCYTDHNEMLEKEKLDCVSVCTANAAHASCSVDALRRGVSVLCEKPMSVTYEEALSMCEAAEAGGALLSIGFQPRFDENMREIKRIVSSGVLGKVYYVQTGGGRRHGIPTPVGTSFIDEKKAGYGALGDIGCYSLDLVLNALGYPRAKTVTGYTSAYFGHDPEYYLADGKPAHYADVFSVDDFAAAFIRLEGDIILDFRIAWAMHIDTPGDTIFLGTKGGLRVPSTDCWNGRIPSPMTLYYDEGGERKQKQIPLHPESEDLIYAKLRNFVDCVARFKEGEPYELNCPGREILRNQEILFAIKRSAELGREVVIE